MATWQTTIANENIQNLSTDITMHMMHILQQYGKGYLTGVKTNRWKKHVFAYARLQLPKFLFIYSAIMFLTHHKWSSTEWLTKLPYIKIVSKTRILQNLYNTFTLNLRHKIYWFYLQFFKIFYFIFQSLLLNYNFLLFYTTMLLKICFYYITLNSICSKFAIQTTNFLLFSIILF